MTSSTVKALARKLIAGRGELESSMPTKATADVPRSTYRWSSFTNFAKRAGADAI